MKKNIHLLYAILAASIYTGSAHASCTDGTGCLQVPGDFSQDVNNFSMYLLGGQFNVDAPNGYGSWWGAGETTPLSTTGKQINFTATPFNHIGEGQGTSTLNATFNHYEIATGTFWGNLTTFYLDGDAAGSLVDTADSTQGHWTLNAHLYGNYGSSLGNDIGVITLSSNAAYQYGTAASSCDSEGIGCATATGQIMNYYSGLTYLVGQGTILNGPFQGIRITLGLQGQDPLVAPATVPVPAAAWLLGSGLLGLAGFARKRKTA